MTMPGTTTKGMADQPGAHVPVVRPVAIQSAAHTRMGAHHQRACFRDGGTSSADFDVASARVRARPRMRAAPTASATDTRASKMWRAAVQTAGQSEPQSFGTQCRCRSGSWSSTSAAGMHVKTRRVSTSTADRR